MKYAKAVLHLVVVLIGAFTVALGTGNNASLGTLDTAHWLLLVGTVLGSTAVVAAVTNLPGIAAGIAKAIVAFLSAGIPPLVVALNDNHISQAEFLVAFSTAVLAAAAVYETPNLVATKVRARRTRRVNPTHE